MQPDFTSTGPFGKVVNEDDSAYHANRAISKSKLCDYIDGGAEFFQQKHLLRSVADEDTPAKLEGRQHHHMMRYGVERFDLDFPVVPDFGDCRVRENKARRDEWRAQHPNWESSSIAPDTRAMLLAMRSSILRHPAARDLVTADGGEHEVTWRYPAESLPFAVQCRTDFINFKGCTTSQRRPYVVDYKSIKNLSRGKDPKWIWENELTERRYFIQDPFYMSVLALCGIPIQDLEFYFVVTEKNPPYATAVFTLDEIARGTGRKMIHSAVTELSECFEQNHWPSKTSSDVQVSTIPEWQLKKAFRASDTL